MISKKAFDRNRWYSAKDGIREEREPPDMARMVRKKMRTTAPSRALQSEQARPGAHCGHGTCVKGARKVSSAKMRMISARTITEIIIENYSGIAPKRSG